MSRTGQRVAAGFSLVEAVVSIVLIAVMFAAVMQTVGAGRIVHYKAAGQRRGALLARQLIAEILQQSYQDPDVPTVVLGLEAGESDRMDFDDVDDYDRWLASPPEDRDGSIEADQVGWSREVSVTWVNPNDLGKISSIESGAKRVIVTVKHNGLVMSEFTAVRTSAFPQVDR